MDTSEYLPMFLAESREHLQELNLAVVRIEEEPDDRATVDEIFRIAHSLKGMSATMGFAAIAALTHEMEDVFELLRQRTDGLTREAIDVLLECLDVLEEAVEAIEADGAEALDPEPLVERLRGLVRERTPEQELDRVGGVTLPDLAGAANDGRRVLHVVVDLSEEALMPAVRAFMLFAALGEHGELIGSIPMADNVEQFTASRIEAWLASDHEDDVIERAAAGVSDVVRVVVHEVRDDPIPPSAEELAADHVPASSAVGAAGSSGAGNGASPAAGTGPAVHHVGGAAAAAHARKGAATVRVDAERLDQLMHFMGELVIHRTVVETLAATAEVPALPQAIQDLARSSQALQQMVMQVRMIPVEAVFLRFPRLVRDLSTKLGKEVELRLVGQETELDRTVVDALGDPLVHLVRNSLDHGLESPEAREAAGKPRTGVLEISARHAGGNVVISVHDDGYGIDPERVARKAVERGLIAPEAVATVDLSRAVELLFTPGFSTAETTSDISGRGVGMDAVQASIRELGGEVVMESVPGQGSKTEIRLPLTLAIMAALLVEAQGLPFAIPLDRVQRTLRLEDHTVRSVAGERMLVLDDGVLPLLDAGEALGRASADNDEAHAHAVIVRGRERRLALAVATLVGQRELVTRPLPREVSDSAAVSGGAVLSNGEIALIVDCDALTARGNPADARPDAAAADGRAPVPALPA